MGARRGQRFHPQKELHHLIAPEVVRLFLRRRLESRRHAGGLILQRYRQRLRHRCRWFRYLRYRKNHQNHPEKPPLRLRPTHPKRREHCPLQPMRQSWRGPWRPLPCRPAQHRHHLLRYRLSAPGLGPGFAWRDKRNREPERPWTTCWRLNYRMRRTTPIPIAKSPQPGG